MSNRRRTLAEYPPLYEVGIVFDMFPFDSDIFDRADEYARRQGFNLVQQLGFGKDGTVWSTNRANQRTALKVHRAEPSYAREIGVYRRLTEHGIADVLGFRVPQMLFADDSLLALEMTIVQPPFLLDFGGADLDHKVDFPEEVLIEWHEEKREEFGHRWPVVQLVLARMESMGIYIRDIHPGNLKFGDEES